MKKSIVVTSYKNPDLDGTASVFAYTEYLNKNGIKAKPSIYGKPHPEAHYILNKIKIKIASIKSKTKKIALLDASDLDALPKEIGSEQVIEIIDHRIFNESEKFTSAKIQIELVGACATLIAEKFHYNKIAISKNSAVLLYSAIMSNTVGLHNKLTTVRDKSMAVWLKKSVKMPDRLIKGMFEYKSKLLPLGKTLNADLKAININNKKIGIPQLEIINADIFVRQNSKRIINSLKKIKQSKKLDYIFLNCIDINKYYNFFVTVDDKSKKMLKSVFKIDFNENVARYETLIMRKEIVPLILKFFKKWGYA